MQRYQIDGMLAAAVADRVLPATADGPRMPTTIPKPQANVRQSQANTSRCCAAIPRSAAKRDATGMRADHHTRNCMPAASPRLGGDAGARSNSDKRDARKSQCQTQPPALPAAPIIASTCMPDRRHVKVVFAGVTVADSTAALRVEETGHGPVHYLPEKDVRLDLMRPTEHHTTCPYKGEASYWTIEAPAGRRDPAVGECGLGLSDAL